MIFVEILSVVITVLIIVGLIYYYVQHKDQIRRKNKRIVSVKEFQEELIRVEEFEKGTEIEIKKLINDFIADAKNQIKNETNHENVKFLLKKINKDIDLITNSFAWQKVQSSEKLKEKFDEQIEFMKKNRPSKWVEL